MDIYTLNVGQGQFVVITGSAQALIVDTYVPLNPSTDIVNVKAALAKILSGKNLVGLIVTGFDSDHFNEVGLKIILNKYRPDWIMYPKYFKPTGNAKTCFSIVEGFEKEKKFTRISVLLNDNNSRFYSTLSTDFTFEVFSPHSADMNSSNNCSLVCKVSDKSMGATYLITGDTEKDRWESIVRYFGACLGSNVLDAPHHGSKNGISRDAISRISPDTVLISAGVNNQYGHPDAEAMQLFLAHAKNVYQTNTGVGQSIRTEISSAGVNSFKFQS
jgi:beta-lactamase superfamily II metal-dependent hydrolase